MIDLRDDQLLTVAAAAKHFGVAKTTIHGWFAKGLAHVKVGGLFFTSMEAIERFAEPADAGEFSTPMERLREIEAAERRLALHFGTRKTR